MKKIKYKDIVYPSMKALFESEAIEGLTYAAFMSRIKNGLSIVDALSEVKNKNVSRKYIVDGREFKNLKELATAASISYEAAVKRSHRGWSDNQIFYGRENKTERVVKEKKKRGIEVNVNGVIYENLRYAFDVLKPSCSFNTLRARLRYGWTLEEALEVVQKVDGRKQVDSAWILDINGVSFNVKEASEKYQVSYSTVLDRLHRGATAEQAVGLEIVKDGDLKTQTEAYKSRSKRVKKEYIVDGVSYFSVAELARAYELPSSLVYNRMRDNGWSADRAVKEEVTEAVEINGKQYRSAMSAWESIGVTNFATYQGRKTQGFPLDICLGLTPLPSEEKYLVGGKTYGSISEVAKAHSLTASQLTSRLNNMSLEEAVVYVPSNGRYTAASFIKDPELANSKGVLYFIKIKLSNGVLHKIGITQKETSQRFNSYKFELIHEVKGRLQDIYELEQLIVKEFAYLHYRAEDEFEGRTETFLLTDEEEGYVLDFIQERRGVTYDLAKCLNLCSLVN